MTLLKKLLLASAFVLGPVVVYGAADTEEERAAAVGDNLPQDLKEFDLPPEGALPSFPSPTPFEIFTQGKDSLEEFCTRVFRGAILGLFLKKYDCRSLFPEIDFKTMSDSIMHTYARVFLKELPDAYIKIIQEKADAGNFVAWSVLGFLAEFEKIPGGKIYAGDCYRKAMEGNVGVAYHNLVALAEHPNPEKRVPLREGETKEDLLQKAWDCGFVASPLPKDTIEGVQKGSLTSIVQLVRKLYVSDRKEEALSYAQEACQQGHISTTALLGYILLGLGRECESKDCFTELAGQGVEVFHELGITLMNLYRWEEAAVLLKQAYGLGDKFAAYRLGRMYYKIEKYEESEHYLKLVYDAGKKWDSAAFLGLTLCEMKRFEDAIPYLEEGIALEKSEGLLQVLTEKLEDAKRKEAQKADPVEAAGAEVIVEAGEREA